MKRFFLFVREHWVRIAATALLLVYASCWGITDAGLIPAFVAFVLWVR